MKDPSEPLAGKGIIVTGASSGLGKAIARACLRQGADIYICARDKDALEDARRDLLIEIGEARVFAMQADVSDPVSVGAFIEAAACHSPNLLGLVNNAGIQGPKGRLEDLDPQEWIRTIEINLLGTMLCCRAVLPALRRANYGKIVNLSGGGATGPRPRMSAYACSKTAVIRLTETLAVEYAAHNINVNAIAPGALNTRMLDEVLKDGPAKVGEAEYAKAVEQKHQGGASVDRAAELCVFLLSKQSDRITGRLISAAWDPWESLPLHWHELEQSEAYTLRRVIPGDLRSEAEKLKEKQALDINSVQRPPHTSLNRAT